MNHRSAILTFLMSAGLLTAAAVAQSEHYSATTAQAVTAQAVGGKKEFIANGNIWRCSASACTLTSEPRDAGSLRTCRELKRQVGQLTAYGSSLHAYDAAKLSKCNSEG